MRARTIRVMFVLLWMGVISYWSHQPTLPIDDPMIAQYLFGLQHKMSHFVGFGTLAVLAFWAFQGLPGAAWLAIILTSTFGALDEFHQSFVPGRSPGVLDWGFNTVSGAAVVYGWTWARRFISSTSSRYSRSVSPTILSIEK
jgi:VanZ family protein